MTEVIRNCGTCKYKDDKDDNGPCRVCAYYKKWEAPSEPLVLPPEAQGIKHDTAKLRYDLYPPEALAGATAVLNFGAAKYSDRNWEKGMEWGRVYAASLRHLLAWHSGEAVDPESGLSHLHHAACCIAFLQTYEARGIGQDDRPVVMKKVDS